MSLSFRIFTRNWWKENKEWPNGLEPDPTARKTHIKYVDTEQEAQEFCRSGNNNRPSSWKRLSRKYEYERA